MSKVDGARTAAIDLDQEVTSTNGPATRTGPPKGGPYVRDYARTRHSAGAAACREPCGRSTTGSGDRSNVSPRSVLSRCGPEVEGWAAEERHMRKSGQGTTCEEWRRRVMLAFFV